MSVIITGMKKHEDCYNCEFHTNYRTNDYGSFCECMLDDECNRINLLEHKIPNFCPLKSIDGLINLIKEPDYTHHDGYYHWYMTPPEVIEIICGIIKEYCKEEKKE